MTGAPLDSPRILAISLSTRGFGYAVLESGNLVDWGVKSLPGGKKVETLRRAENLMITFTPTFLVMHDIYAKGSKRGNRATQTTKDLRVLAKGHGIKTTVFSRAKIHRTFFGDETRNKHSIAEEIAKRFPEELGTRLPAKRRLWMSESYSMGIFDAVSLALAFIAGE